MTTVTIPKLNPEVQVYTINPDNGYTFSFDRNPGLDEAVIVPPNMIGVRFDEPAVRGEFLNTLCSDGNGFTDPLYYNGRNLLSVRTAKVVPTIHGELSERSKIVLQNLDKGVLEASCFKYKGICRQFGRKTGGLTLNLQVIPC